MIVLSNDIKQQILRCAILIEQCVTRTGIFADMGVIIPAPANVISERFSIFKGRLTNFSRASSSEA